jgi:pyrroloquinoline quinone biosynthesis protein E
MGFLSPVDTASPAIGLNRDTTLVPPWPAQDQPVEWAGSYTLSAPEVIHLGITARCNQACPGCYVPRSSVGSELPVSEWRALIDQWAQMHVFQLAVGGGEPLLYEGLVDVLRYARQRGIVPNLTTNGTLLGAATVRELECAGVVRVNLSWNGPTDDTDKHSLGFGRALPLLLDSTLRVGVNLLVTPALLSRLPQVLGQLRAQGVRQVTILRPKPPAFSTEASEVWYDAHRLRRADLLTLRDVLSVWQKVLDLQVGSALVGLMGDAAPAHLRWRGVCGCTAGRRICTVWPDGRITPCSFLADLSAGNVCQVPFAELWARGEGWEQLRDPRARLQGGCADCTIVAQCSGACCVARYETGHTAGELFPGDTECPRIA